MKKSIITIVLLAVIIGCFVGCTPKQNPQKDLYESFVEDVANDGTGIRAENSVWNLEYFKKQNMTDKTISVCGKTYKGNYSKSIIDKYNSYTTDLYCDENYIEFGLRSDTGELVLFNRMNAEFFDTEPYLDDVSEPEQNAISLATKIAGDYVIKNVGIILKENFRSSDYVCRLGGDEFLIMLTNYCEEKFILDRCEKIQYEISDKLMLPNHIVTMSMGIAIDNNCNKIDVILKKADESLYISKNSGKNQVTLSDSIDYSRIKKM